MASHPLKKFVVTLGLWAGLALASAASATAFTETKVPPPAGQSAPLNEGSQFRIETPEQGSGLSILSPGDANSRETELSIPGVGSIGKLPKLDFGLELLYGSGSGQGAESPLENKDDDVLIKGKIRHRF